MHYLNCMYYFTIFELCSAFHVSIHLSIRTRSRMTVLWIFFLLFYKHQFEELDKVLNDKQIYTKTRRLFVLDFYLNNRVTLSRNYRLIVAPRKFDVLQTYICLRSSINFERTSLLESFAMPKHFLLIVHSHTKRYCSQF